MLPLSACKCSVKMVGAEKNKVAHMSICIRHKDNIFSNADESTIITIVILNKATGTFCHSKHALYVILSDDRNNPSSREDRGGGAGSQRMQFSS